MVTAGYLSNDFLVQVFYVRDYTGLSCQSICHHFVSLVGIFAGLSAGYALPGITFTLLIIEISTIFINYRSMYDVKDYGKPVP